MSEAAPSRQPAGNIYDLGYRHYEGVRLGRSYAARSLFVYSFWSVWGIGRSWMAKLFPMGLAAIALIPALILLAIAALAPDEFEVAKPEDYYGFVSIVLALFCAVAAPELVGRDQRQRTLALYFSRALSRFDYASTKVAALVLSLFLVLVVPQVFLQVGNGVAADSLSDYFKDNLDVLPPIIASSAIVAVFMGAISLAIAIQTPRRAFAMGAVIAAFAILSALGGILVNTVTGDAQKYALLISPFGLLEGLVYWVFSVEPPFDSNVTKAGLDGVFYFVASIAYAALALAIVYRRIERMGV
ncbi:MAG TPA: ABC transporter permease subunit [Dehalococcoidia bacterium]|nr:ABC transporter permease subunit [Dehalococcoidia bacterium]